MKIKLMDLLNILILYHLSILNRFLGIKLEKTGGVVNHFTCLSKLLGIFFEYLSKNLWLKL